MMNEDALLAALNTLPPEMGKRVLDAVNARLPGTIKAYIQTLQDAPEEVNPFLRGLISADNLPKSVPPVRCWFGLYPRSVILLIGETGAGKSSLLYNLCIHAARNEPLWEIPFGLNRPLRILYIDPENSGNFAEGHGGQCSVKMERIGQGSPKDLFFHDGQGLNLSNDKHLNALKKHINDEKIDVVVLDPIANLFQTKDENDNAEAASQMTSLTLLSRETGACIIPVHHTGKTDGGNYGRGASARLAAADVAMVFRCKGNDDEIDDTFDGQLLAREDLCRLQIVKNRLEGRGSLYLKMAGDDKFVLSTFVEWKGRGQSSHTPKKEKAEDEIYLYLADQKAHSRAEIQEAMKEEGYGQNAVDVALKALVAENIISLSRQGKGGISYYQLISESPVTENTPPSESFIVSYPSIGNHETMKLKIEESVIDDFLSEPDEDDDEWHTV